MIQTHGDSFKTQFSLATSKPNSYWQHQSPILINTTLSKKEKSPRLSKLGKEKNIMLPKQERPIANIYEETQKKKKVFTNKSPRGIKTHGNMRTQLSPCE